MRRTADANGVLWQKGCFRVVYHRAGGGRSERTLRHTERDTQTDTHGCTLSCDIPLYGQPQGARRICPNKDRHRHTQNVTPTCTTTHTRTRKTAAETLLHSTPPGARRENIHNTQTHRNTHLHRHCTATQRTHYAHARTRAGTSTAEKVGF